MKKVCLVTIVDTVSTTSIPVNEFVIYRHGIRDNFRQIVFSRLLTGTVNVTIPEGIDIKLIPKKSNVFRRQIKDILSECKRNNEAPVFHLHHQKSALLFLKATLFMGLRPNTVFTIHSFYSGRDLLYKISSVLCVLWANYSNCVSDAAYNDYPRWIRIIKGKRMTAILNGIDCKRIEKALSQERIPTDSSRMRKIVCVDRMIPIKNQSFIVKLMKYLPETQLTLVGAEDEHKAIRRMAINEGVADRVVFTGLLQRDEVYRVISKCGLYVSASVVEGLHLSVLEAMRIGAIPIISDIAPHREISEKCNHLIETLPLKESLWVEKIKVYQNKEPRLVQQQSSQLSIIAKEVFSLDKMHDQYDKIYNLIARKECSNR